MALARLASVHVSMCVALGFMARAQGEGARTDPRATATRRVTIDFRSVHFSTFDVASASYYSGGRSVQAASWC